ncbi:MAG: hypothetical protein RL215_1997 [Planctomycetota bacterium]
MNSGDWFSFDPAGFGVEALLEHFDEVRIEFDEVKLIVWLEELDDAVCDGSGTGADFENAGGLLGISPGEEASHRMSEEAAAGGDSTSSLESPAELGEEREVVLKCAGHLPSSVRANRLWVRRAKFFQDAAASSRRSSSSMRSERDRAGTATGSPTGAFPATSSVTRFSAATTVE